MPKVLKDAKQGRHTKRAVRSDTAYLDKLIEEATVDCYNESQEITAIFTMLEENLAVPFATKLLGVEVTVERVHQNDAGEIVAVCRRGRERLRVPIIDLPMPEPKPKETDCGTFCSQTIHWSGDGKSRYGDVRRHGMGCEPSTTVR